MEDNLRAAKAQSAESKLRSGALLDIQEVAAKLDVSHSTVHRLPLPSIWSAERLFSARSLAAAGAGGMAETVAAAGAAAAAAEWSGAPYGSRRL